MVLEELLMGLSEGDSGGQIVKHTLEDWVAELTVLKLA